VATLFSVDVELQHVVDLTKDETLRLFGVTADELTEDWRAIVLDEKIPITHAIGAAAREAGVEALVYPSARLSGASNLAVIVDRLRCGARLRINPPDGFAPPLQLRSLGRGDSRHRLVRAFKAWGFGVDSVHIDMQ
jgi:RES domain-containing protein